MILSLFSESDKQGIVGSVPLTSLLSEDVMLTSAYFSLVFPNLLIWSLNVSLCSLLRGFFFLPQPVWLSPVYLALRLLTYLHHCSCS